jgi:hypothetical protein
VDHGVADGLSDMALARAGWAVILIRSGGHQPKGSYGVQDVQSEEAAQAA